MNVTTAPSSGLTLAHLAPEPRTHNFVLGATGSGKSTLVYDMVEEYHRLHSSHHLWIIDPKPELFPERKKEYGRRVFPLGTLPVVRRKREGVVCNGRLVRDADGFKWPKDETVFVIQSVDKALEFLRYRLAHPDVTAPSLAVFLESVHFIGHARADAEVRHTLQLGRQIGLGSVLIHQTPTWVDGTFMSESSRLYVGHLRKLDHRKRVVEAVSLPDAKRFLEPVAPRYWWMIDQTRGRAYYFTLDKSAQKGGDAH